MENQKKNEFEKYYRQYFTQVRGYILKRVFNEQMAEDLTMDVFCTVWDKFEVFDESKASFQTWLYVIVNNKLKNYYRDRKDNVELDESIAIEDNQADEIVEAIQLQDMREQLYTALEELNETQRKIVIYKYFKDMNANEIADLLGLSAGNVRILLKRALDKIRFYFNQNNIRWE